MLHSSFPCRHELSGEHRLCFAFAPGAEIGGAHVPETAREPEQKAETAKDFCKTPEMLNDHMSRFMEKGVDAAQKTGAGMMEAMDRAEDFCSPFGVHIGVKEKADQKTPEQKDPYPKEVIPTPGEVASAIPNTAPDAAATVDKLTPKLTPNVSDVDNGTGKSVGGAPESVLTSVMPLG